MGEEIKSLALKAVIGFSGEVPGGLIYHPDGGRIIYPLGSTLVIKNLRTNNQVFLRGHTGPITCLTLSHNGNYIASGQSTSMGFKADIIIWDIETGSIKHKLTLHKVKIQDLSFSVHDTYLVSLGGQDDNNIVVWEVETGTAICGSPAGPESANCVKWVDTEDENRIVMGGRYILRRWKFDRPARKLFPSDTFMGSVRRIVNCVTVSPNHQLLYCGTHTGDLLEVNISDSLREPRFVRASKERFPKGVTALSYISGGSKDFLLVGTGGGLTVRMPLDTLGKGKAAEVAGAISSVSLSEDQRMFFAGTASGNTYSVDVASMTPKLKGTSHHGPVNDIGFVSNCSDLFISCSTGDIRLWNCNTSKELLRIQVPNLVCHCVNVTANGKSIVSGWSDGKIRSFFPETGKLQYVITDAHKDGVSAIASTKDCRVLVSGGKDGRVRIWKITPTTQVMEASFKEHKGEISSIIINKSSTECISASADGSCIIWSLKRLARLNAMFATTIFKSIKYHPDESQMITCGSDRKITYWDAFDCNAIRILDGSSCELNALDVESTGTMFASGGNDRVVSLWKYDDGLCIGQGVGHSGAILALQISPDKTKMVTAGDEGAIFVWEMPELASAVEEEAEAEEKATFDDMVDLDDIREELGSRK